MKIKTSELTGAALDWAVAKCKGIDPIIRPYNTKAGAALYSHGGATIPLEYSTNWAQGGPIIDRLFKQGLRLHTAEYVTGVRDKNLIAASLDSPNGFWFGPTPLIAAMRCYVASKLGDEVEVPEELTCSPIPKNG